MLQSLDGNEIVDTLDRKVEQNEGLSRRNFIDRILLGWGMLVVLPILYGVIRYLLPVRKAKTGREKVVVGRVSDLAPNSAKIVRLDGKPVVIIKTRSGQVKAVSARCTHLGCTVEFNRELGGHLSCNCHGSRFDLNGKIIRGPASRPLPPYKVTLEDDRIALTEV